MNAESVNNGTVFNFAGIRVNFAVCINLVRILQIDRVLVAIDGHIRTLKQCCGICNGKCIVVGTICLCTNKFLKCCLRKLCSEPVLRGIIRNIYTSALIFFISRSVYLNVLIILQIFRRIRYFKYKIVCLIFFRSRSQQYLRHFHCYLIRNIIANAVVGCFNVFIAIFCRSTILNFLLNIGARVSNSQFKVFLIIAFSSHFTIICNGNFLARTIFYFKVMRGLIRDECFIAADTLFNKAVITCRKATDSNFA